MYQQHPLSAAYPAMQTHEYQALLDSVMAIGVQNPITLYEGQVIDGWHRYKAAAECGMECPSVEMGDVDPRDFAKSQGARRNITASQNALAITAIYAWRPMGRVAAGNSAVTAELPKTTKQLAVIAGVGTRTIEQAKVVHAGGVQAVRDAVKTGTVSVETAAAVARLPTKEQEKIAAKGPDALRAAAKSAAKTPGPPVVEPATEAPPEYTALDAAYEQITELQSELVVARMGDIPEEHKTQAAERIAALQAEVDTLTATLKAVQLSRDSLMEERAQMVRQMKAQRDEIARLKAKN